MPIIDLARAAEQRGFTGIFLNEHTHLPVEHPRSTFPGGGATPDTYGRFWDPFVALSFVAAHTGLEVGTAVSLVGEHDPIALAKAVATLDVLSGGRMVLGVGWGWNREEFEDHGRPARTRAEVALEVVDAMTALWTEAVASFDGTHIRFGPSHAWPKPVRRAGRVRPPVLLGAPMLDRNLDRVVRHFDGWIPMAPNSLLDGSLVAPLAELRRRWADAGRDPNGPRIMAIYGGGRPDRLAEARERAADLGVQRVLVYVGELDEPASLGCLDRLAPAVGAS